MEPPPIILKSLETTDNTLNLPHSGLVLVGDNANNGYTLGEIEDETEFVSDLLELDLHSLNNNAMYQIVDANYVYQPPPPGSWCINLSEFKLFSLCKSNIYYWQDLNCKYGAGGDFGRLCGISWCSLYRQYIYDMESLVILGNTTLFFSFMDQMIQPPKSQRIGFMRCTRQLVGNIDKTGVDVEILTTM